MECKTFEGKPCHKCGSTTRYVKGHRCQNCVSERGKIRRAGKSTAGFSQRPKVYAVHHKNEETPTYEGKPCKHCGGTTRYLKIGTCVACKSRYARENRERKRQYGNSI